MKKMIVVLLLTASAITGMSQRIVTGTVVDGANAFPLQGAIITARGHSDIAQTDAYGIFSIIIPDTVVTLVVSYTGYEEKEVLATSVSLLKIFLERSGLRYDDSPGEFRNPGYKTIITCIDTVHHLKQYF